MAGEFVCPECSRPFDTAQGLSAHRTTHSGPAKCPQCGKECHSQRGLARHLSMSHSGRKNYAATQAKHRHLEEARALQAETQSHIAYLYGGFYRDIRNYADSTAIPWTTLASGVSELLSASARRAVLGAQYRVSELSGDTAEGNRVRITTVAVDVNAHSEMRPQQEDGAPTAREAVRLLGPSQHDAAERHAYRESKEIGVDRRFKQPASSLSTDPHRADASVVSQETFGEIIEHARMERGLSLAEAAKKGPYFSVAGLRNIELNKRRPASKTVERFATHYHLDKKRLYSALARTARA